MTASAWRGSLLSEGSSGYCGARGACADSLHGREPSVRRTTNPQIHRFSPNRSTHPRDLGKEQTDFIFSPSIPYIPYERVVGGEGGMDTMVRGICLLPPGRTLGRGIFQLWSMEAVAPPLTQHATQGSCVRIRTTLRCLIGRSPASEFDRLSVTSSVGTP